MARYHGKNGKVIVGGSGVLAEVSDWSMDSSRSMADASAMLEDDTRSLPGQKSRSISITCSYDPDDAAGQEALQTAFENGETSDVTLWELPSATGRKYWSGTIWVEKVGEKVSVGSKVERTYTCRNEGAFTRQTVS